MKQEILIICSNEQRSKMLQDALQSNLINAHCALSVEDAVRHLIRYEDQLVIVNAAAPFPDLEGALESIRVAHMMGKATSTRRMHPSFQNFSKVRIRSTGRY